jgi:two-component system, NtrC family, sensor kinase
MNVTARPLGRRAADGVSQSRGEKSPALGSAARRRASPGFRLLWTASVALPLAGVALAGWWAWTGIVNAQSAQMARTVDMLHEQTLRAFETQDAVLTALEAFTANMSWQEIETDRAVYDFTHRLMAATPTVETLGMVAPDGLIGVASESPNVPRTVKLSDRDYVKAFPTGTTRTSIFVGEVLVSRVDGRIQVHISRPRIGPDGRPDGGIVTSAFSPAYFERFFRGVAETRATGFTLARDDGAVLARFPHSVTGAGTRVPEGDPALAAAAASARSGRAVVLRSGSLLGGIRMTAARKIGNYPLFVSHELDPTVLRDAWLRQMAFPAIGALAAMAMLLTLTAKAQRRTADEQVRLIRRTESAETGQALAQERAQLEARLRQNDKVAALGQLAAGLAHDFNNVLQSIMASAEALDRQEAADDEMRKIANLILRTSERGMALTRRMLDHARRDDQPEREMDVAAGLRNAVELLSRTLGAMYTLRLDLALYVPRARGNPAEFETVLINLAVNARDAMPAGGEITMAAAPAGPIDVAEHGLEPGQYVRVSVTDNGTGMDAPTLARAGEAFFTTKGPGQGTGLGLSMARGFARRAGGALSLDSRPGQGTTVLLLFPAV